VVLKSSYTKGSKIRLCTGGAVTILQCGTPIPIDEDDLKYGDRDITSGSLVFRFSKGNEAGDGPLPETIYKPKLLSNADLIIQLKIKAKVSISCDRKVHT
jgi:hypothetical protein